jgi:small subunit ribosomal protein S16
MVRIRFRRMGLKRQPIYRIVVTDGRNSRDGAFLEVIGHHNPRTRPSTDYLDEARALYWLGVGAQPSEAVESLMKRTGTLDRFARLRQGEDLEKLLEEAQPIMEANKSVSQRTRFPSPGPGEGKKSRAAAAAGAEAVAEAVAEAPAADTEAEADEE